MARRDEKSRAKAIVLEIVRQSGGTLRDSRNLFDAFWRAHVAVLERGGSDLSFWPIVRLSAGPGIGQFERLLAELLLEGELVRDELRDWVFRASQSGDYAKLIDAADAANIADGLAFAARRAAEGDREPFPSRSWRTTEPGDRMDVQLDAIPDEEFAVREQKLRETAAIW